MAPRPANELLYPDLAGRFHDASSEEAVAAFWREHDVFRRSIAAREGAPDWVFYEGPPTANGLPGVHHVMARLCKDLMCRFKTMTGHRVVRKAGWDTHGLPVERSVEKKLGIQGAQAIVDYGLEPFNAQCRESVWTCKSDWDEFTEKLGYWVDLDDPYITYDNDYIETVWWILGQFHAKDLLYKGHKVVPYCPVCATPISSHEMANSYRSVNDPSIFVRLKAVDADESFLTWTTTPWTLPSNVALAVGEDFDYVRVRHGDEVLVLAEARLSVLDEEVGYEILETFKGRELVGRRYEQLLPFVSPGEGEDAFRVVTADFVTLDTGTGIVHMAPAFGEDDYQVGRREGLAFFRPVDANGEFTAEVKPWAGMHVKKADKHITKHLDEQGSLYAKATYTHDYPFHDRCDNALIYFATPSWFIKTSAMREQLVAANKDITWAPPEMGSRRFGNWLEGNIDWSLSRNRFWGTPLNVWICDDCGHLHLPTSRAELSELTGTDQADLDLHRPAVDGIEFPCTADGCTGTMGRTPEVIDCWFDSGSMPFAQYHYPFENEELFASQYPADFISEGVDQTRGWFYTMLVIGTFLTGRSSYKRCLVNELILDAKGKKMSKSVGNTVDPMDIMRNEGADPLRWYMATVNPVWIPTKFDRDGVGEARSKLLGTLENTYRFFATYANLDGWTPDPARETAPDLLDCWILSRLQSVAASVRTDLEAMNLTRAGKTLGTFVLDDVSNWYVRLSRKRFWHGDVDTDKHTAYTTLHTVLETTLRLLAPFVPFTAEELYRGLRAHADAEVSVHLQDFPVADGEAVNSDLERRMAAAQEAVRLGRSARQISGVKTRQPLGRLCLFSPQGTAAELVDDPVIGEYLRMELNVKELQVAAELDSLADQSAKANFRALGPRFGKEVPRWAAAIAALDPQQIARLGATGKIEIQLDGRTEEFGGEEVQVTLEGKGAFVVAGSPSLVSAIDTTIDDVLKAEGIAREIINKVQNLRKKSGLEVSDRIVLAITGPARVLAAVESHTPRIRTEVLADDVAAAGELPYKETFVIEGDEVSVALDRI
ncbi:MAG: isoleucine--tRNA ligase [bacterium]|nr:isoleucine--tRNA ligase [bacterium]